MKRRYGIEAEEFDRLLQSQGGRCAICGSEPAEGKALHIDHDHATGAIRGLLCLTCNFMVGAANDSPDVLVRAIEYLTAAEAIACQQ